MSVNNNTVEVKDISKDLFVPLEENTLNADMISRPSIGYWKGAFIRFKKNPIAVFATVILLAIIAFAIFAPIFSEFTYDQNNWALSNKAPMEAHPFGTDSLGRDLWVRSWEGARVSLSIGIVVAFVNATLGILYGGISGFLGGKADILMMRVCEVIGAIPSMLWTTLLVIVLRPGVAPLIIALSATGWIGMARLFRGQVLSLKQSEFVMASRSLGTGSLWIIIKHLVPNAMSPIITSMAFSIPGAIFAEAFLSYIGLGLPLPMASWGNLASDGANNFLIYPYQLIYPAILICITMLSFTLIGDALRDALDPRVTK